MTPLKQLFRQPVRLFAIFLLVGMASAFICLSAGVFASAKATLGVIAGALKHCRACLAKSQHQYRSNRHAQINPGHIGISP